ncbi:MAG: TonB-dependent siderophore receptor [Luteibacter sp.]
MISSRHSRPRLISLAIGMALAAPVAAQSQVPTQTQVQGPSAAQDQSTQDPSSASDTNTATTLDAVKVKGQRAPTYTVDESGAATRLPLSLQDTPQSISVITEQRIEDQNLTSVRAVLDNTTGVFSSAYDTERVVFYARGFQVENMAYDGVPLAPGINASSADGSLDTSIYDRIEVVRGASGLLSGAGSPSALINFVRKHADSRTFQADATVSVGSQNEKRASVDLSTPLNQSGSVRGRLVATHDQSDSYLDRYSTKKDVVYGVVDADLGDNTTLSVGFDWQKSRPKGVTWGSYPVFYDDGGFINWRRGFTSAADWSRWTNTTKTGFIDLKHEFANGWQLHALASRRETEGNSQLFYVYGFPNRETGAGVDPYAFRGLDRGQQNMVDLYASGPFEAFGREHELVIGANGSHYRKDSSEYAHGDLPPIDDFLAWNGDYPRPDFASTADRYNLSLTKQSGLYVATRLQLADPLKLVAGARYARWTNDTNDTSAGVYHQRANKTIPYAGLIYEINPTYSAFASYTQIFDPQDNRRADGSFLDPMTGSSREVGIKGRHFNGLLNTSVTFFETRQDNVAEALPGEFLPDGLTQAYRAANGTKSRGFEAEASGQLSDMWNATLGWSHFNIKGLNDDGTTGALRTALPRTLVRLFTTYTLPGSWSNVTVGGGANWQSASHAPVDGPDGPQRVNQASVTLVSAMAKYTFNPQAYVQLNADNLLNRKYFVLDQFSNLYYAAPNSVTLTFNYKFL